MGETGARVEVARPLAVVVRVWARRAGAAMAVAASVAVVRVWVTGAQAVATAWAALGVAKMVSEAATVIPVVATASEWLGETLHSR